MCKKWEHTFIQVDKSLELYKCAYIYILLPQRTFFFHLKAISIRPTVKRAHFCYAEMLQTDVNEPLN